MTLLTMATLAKARGADFRGSSARPARAPVRPDAGPVLHRCACGGGCPRCRGADAGLAVSQPGDADEVAAERMAGAALRSSPSSVLRRAADGPAGVEAANLPSPLGALRGGGRPLPDSVRGELEPRFGADFGAVRVHADEGAAELAERYHAQAFTVGRDVVFGKGRYAPESSGGRALLAHELAHVAQQNGPVDGSRLQAKVVDDDEHLPCRATYPAADLAARENDAATRADAAAAAIRATPVTETTRALLWTRFGLDYNDPRTRCRMVASITDRFEDIARELREMEITYHCAATGEPDGPCHDEPTSAYAWTTVNVTRRMDLCSSFWSSSDPLKAETLLHEWAHYLFRRRGLSDDASSAYDNAECYAAFAFEVTGGPAVWDDTGCPPRTDPLPARDAARIDAPCPTNVFGGVSLTGGYLTGIPGGGHYGTVSLGWDLHLPITRMHDWEATLGPRLTAAIPGEGGSRPPLAYLLGVRAGVQFRYTPWRFGFNVGGYAEGGAAAFPSTSTVPGERGAYGLNPYAVGGVTGGLNVPIGRETAFRLFLDVGAGAGLNTSDNSAFGLFQAGLGTAFEFR